MNAPAQISGSDAPPPQAAENVQNQQTGNEQTPNNDSVTPEPRPEWLPQKFKDAKQLAESYAELEKLVGQSRPADQQQQQAQPTPEQQQQQPAAVTEEAFTAQAAAKKLDLTPFREEFARTGTLSPETVQKLEEQGFDRQFVVNYVEGARAKQNEVINAFYKSIDGKDPAKGQETWQVVQQWAGTSGPKAEVDAFNRAATSGDPVLASLAAQGLLAAYQRENGKSPNLLRGDTTNHGSDAFRDTDEYTRAIKDPRYKTSSAYRADVDAKLSRSKNVF